MTYIPSITNKVDTNNTTAIPLAGNSSFTGGITDVSAYNSVTVNLFSTQNSATDGFKMGFSQNGTNFTYATNDIISYVANTEFSQSFQVTGKFFQIIYTNGSTAQTTFRLQSLLSLNQPTAYLNSNTELTTKTSSTLTTTKLTGLLPNGEKYTDVRASVNGAVSVSIVEPLTAFGLVNTATNDTVLQGDFVYGINTDIYKTIISGTGSSVTTSPNIAIVSSGTVARSLGYLQSLRNARYRSGQGIIIRFTAIFTTGVTGNNQLVGAGNFKSGVYFGYKDTVFGINRLAGGVLAIQTLTVATAATNGTATINLFDGATTRAFSVTVDTTAPVTPQVGTQITAAQIAAFDYTTQYPGWIASSNGNVVTFICMNAQPNNTVSATFSAAGAASGASVTTGVAPSGTGAGGEDEFIPQSQWNVDVMDGTKSILNPSGMLLIPTFGNLYQINFQYQGFGSMNFFIENPNNGLFQLVHRIQYANNFIVTNLKTPNLSFQMFSRNITNTTAVPIKSASNYIAIQGIYKDLGVQRTYVTSSYNLPGSPTEFQLFAMRPSVIFNSQYSVINIVPISLIVANDETDSFRVNLYLSPTTYQASTTSWSNASLTPSANTSMLIAQQPNSGTLPTVATGGILLTSINVPTGGSIVIDLQQYNLLINYFQSLSVGIISVGSVTANLYSVAINWIEQQ